MDLKYSEFQKKTQDAHNCDKCQGKIFCVSIDKLGVNRCAYCNEVVIYPLLTKEELKAWMGDLFKDEMPN